MSHPSDLVQDAKPVISVYVVFRDVGRDEDYSSKVVKVFSYQWQAEGFVRRRNEEANRINGLQCAVNVLMQEWHAENKAPSHGSLDTDDAWSLARDTEERLQQNRFGILDAMKDADIPCVDDVYFHFEEHTLEQ